MQIEFSGEASDSFRQAVANIAGYHVKITAESGRTFDGRLLGPDLQAEWGDTVRIDRTDENDEPTGNVESIRVERIFVY